MSGGGSLRATGEAALARTWAERRVDPADLVDADGVRYQVVYPGRHTGGPGPDFQGALLALEDGTLLRGDVEIHRRASDWRRHGHAADAAYAPVILHVVAQRDEVVRRLGGTVVPTVQLRTLALPVAQSSATCAARSGPEVLARVLEAGERRFLERAARLEADVEAVGPHQALWRAVMEGLGYSRNREPMARLADHAPWSDVPYVARCGGETALAAWLLGTAGLADTMDSGEWWEWELLQRRMGVRAMMSPLGWQRSTVRPANLPEVRLRGLAHLAAGWGREWPRRELASVARAAVARAAVEERPPLEQLFRAPPQVGAGRARVLLANALLPWAHAVGSEDALALYRQLPGEPSNQATRHMAAELGVAARDLRSMCAQQGLVQLFKQACAGRWCDICPARATNTAGRLAR